jgi:hypothetical protein
MNRRYVSGSGSGLDAGRRGRGHNPCSPSTRYRLAHLRAHRTLTSAIDRSSAPSRAFVALLRSISWAVAR